MPDCAIYPDKTKNKKGWGAKVIDRIFSDLVYEFPDMKGFSVRNLKYMRKFAETWRDISVVQELAQITRYPHIALLDKVKDREKREWYIRRASLLNNLPIQTIFEKYPGTAKLFYIFHKGEIFKLPVSGQEGDSE